MKTMNKNTNPWMIATIFLSGLILGFGLGRIGIGVAPSSMMAYNGAQDGRGMMGSGAQDGNTAGTKTQPTLQTKPANSYDVLEKSNDGQAHYTIGNKNAKVKVVEFSDFQCPFCFRYFAGAFPKIMKDYIATGKISYTYYNFPLNIHPQAPKAAEAALCAGEQNKYWEYHDLLFSNQNMWSGNNDAEQVFGTLAQTLSLDGGKFTQCLSSGKYTKTVESDTELGDKKGISGTPTVYINNQKIVGAQDYYTFKKAIEEELKK